METSLTSSIAAPSTSSLLKDDDPFAQLKDDFKNAIAPLKAFNEKSPVQNQRKSQEFDQLEQKSYMSRLESFTKFVCFFMFFI